MDSVRRVVAVLWVAALVAASCGGEDVDAVSVFPSAFADEIAQAALPELSDLPGTGWRVIEPPGSVSRADRDRGFLPAGADLVSIARAECEAFEASTEDLDDSELQRIENAGVARVWFELPTDEDFAVPAEIRVEIHVHEAWVLDLDRADRIREQAAASYDLFDASDAFDECLLAGAREELAGELDPDVQQSVTVREPRLRPDLGAAFGFRIDVSVVGHPIVLVTEIHDFLFANARVVVTFIGSPEIVTLENVQTLLEVVEAELEDELSTEDVRSADDA